MTDVHQQDDDSHHPYFFNKLWGRPRGAFYNSMANIRSDEFSNVIHAARFLGMEVFLQEWGMNLAESPTGTVREILRMRLRYTAPNKKEPWVQDDEWFQSKGLLPNVIGD